MLLLVIALAPSIALIIYFYSKDKYEKEPLSLLIKAFFAGFFVTFLVVVFELILMFAAVRITEQILRIFFFAFVIAAGVEEGFKFLVFRLLIYKNKEFNEPYDGILYAVMISLGFATMENIFYVVSFYLKAGFKGIVTVGIERAILAVPLHALAAVIMGYYFGMAKTTKDKALEKKYIFAGLGLAILAHGFYDFFLLFNSVFSFICLLILGFFCLIFSLKAIKLHTENSPFKNE